MQLLIVLGKQWNLNFKFITIKLLSGRLSIELLSLFTFAFIVLNESKYAKIFYLIWLLLLVLAYKLRSHIKEFYIDQDEIIDLFNQHRLTTNDDWLNWFLIIFWPKLNLYLNRKFKNHVLNLLSRFLTLENFSIGSNPPSISSLHSAPLVYDLQSHEKILCINFDLYWLLRASSLADLKLFGRSVGKLLSFGFRCSCQIQLRFVKRKTNDEDKLKEIRISFTNSQTLFLPIHSTGLIWLLDGLSLVHPFLSAYLKNKKYRCFIFKTDYDNDDLNELVRRPKIGNPIALFCIDILQAENLPKQKKVKLEQKKSEDSIQKRINRCCFLKSKKISSTFCIVKVSNQQFISPSKQGLTPFWNFRSFLPIFSHEAIAHNQTASVFQNPIDLNSSFYQTNEQSLVVNNLNCYKQFLNDLSISIQLFNKQSLESKLIGEFKINDPSQYILDDEQNGQSIWISSSTITTDTLIRLNVRFTFLTLNQTSDSNILSNAYLGILFLNFFFQSLIKHL